MWEHSSDSAGEIALWSPWQSYVLARSWMDCWFTNVLPNPNKQQGICVNPTQMYSQCMLTLDLLHSSCSPRSRTRLCLHTFSGLQVCHLVSPLGAAAIRNLTVSCWSWAGASEGKYLFILSVNFFLKFMGNHEICKTVLKQQKKSQCYITSTAIKGYLSQRKNDICLIWRCIKTQKQ